MRWVQTNTGGGGIGPPGPPGPSGAVTVHDLGTITTTTLITVPVVVSALLVVCGVMDGTGHVVTWDTMFQWYPDIPTDPNVGFCAMFVGIGSKWVASAMPIVGVHP